MSTTTAPVYLANILFRVKYTFRLRRNLDGDPFLDTKVLVINRDDEGRLLRYEIPKTDIVEAGLLLKSKRLKQEDEEEEVKYHPLDDVQVPM